MFFLTGDVEMDVDSVLAVLVAARAHVGAVVAALHVSDHKVIASLHRSVNTHTYYITTHSLIHR